MYFGGLLYMQIRKSLFHISVFILITGFFISCVVKQDIYLKANGSGHIDFSVEVEPFLSEIFNELAVVTGDESVDTDEGIFKLDEIREGFEKRRHAQVMELSTPDPEKLTGTLRFDDITAVFAEENTVSSAVTLTKENGKTTLHVRLNRENFQEIASVNPSFQTPIFESFGPAANEGISEAEYTEMMEYILGNEKIGSLKTSFIEIRIHPEGTILSQEGGKLEGKTAVFRIPLIRFLLLDEPIEYSVTYR
jgi:hypothetical protein